MIFQVLDDKKQCKKIYCDGQIHNGFVENMSSTWEFKLGLPPEVSYARLYCGGKKIDEVCPEFLRDEWLTASNKLKAYLNSFIQAKIDLGQHCFYDLVPRHFLMDFFKVKSEITEHVIKNYPRPANYDFLLKLAVEIEEIKGRALNIDMSRLNKEKHSLAVRNFLKKIKKTTALIDYNIFGTKTGRLTTKPGSFPILTMKREYRSILKPNNDLYIELDYNAAELRTLMALMGEEQPKGDIHDWNAKNVFHGISRREAKERIFAWLYNPDSKDCLANQSYDRLSVKEKYWDGKMVNTPFGRQIKADEFHALNYLIQSTTSDLVLRQFIKVAEMLKNKKSYVAFVVHDSLIIDFAKEEREILPELIKVFENTRFGKYKVSAKAGKSFGELKEVL